MVVTPWELIRYVDFSYNAITEIDDSIVSISAFVLIFVNYIQHTKLF